MMEGVKYIKVLGKELKTKVSKNLKADPKGVKAANLCSENAQKLAKEAMKDFPKNINPKVAKIIKFKYPEDKATRFKVGDIEPKNLSSMEHHNHSFTRLIFG